MLGLVLPVQSCLIFFYLDGGGVEHPYQDSCIFNLARNRLNYVFFYFRPILLVMTVIATLVFLYWWFVLRFSENDDKAKPLRVNIFEPNEMKESIIEEVDDTEHLYLEQ